MLEKITQLLLKLFIVSVYSWRLDYFYHNTLMLLYVLALLAVVIFNFVISLKIFTPTTKERLMISTVLMMIVDAIWAVKCLLCIFVFHDLNITTLVYCTVLNALTTYRFLKRYKTEKDKDKKC